MPQTVEGVNDLFTKAKDVEVHLNKCRKRAKESGNRTGQLLCAMIAPHEKALHNVDSSLSKKM